MARPLLFLPPGTTVEVTTRTIRRMLLLPATRQFARIVVGVLAHAQELYPVLIHSAVMVSNHWHLILTPESREQLADFMEYVNGNVAREACRLVDWSGTLWGDRYHPVPITSETKALVDRLAYHLAHGVKENLVARVTDWEGLHCAQELMDGVPLDGVWYNRTLMGEANRGRKVDKDQLKTHYALKLAPLPCWKDLPLATRRQLVREIVDKIEIDAAERRAATGKGVVGMAAVREQDPLTRPRRANNSPRPLVHAATQPARKAFETVAEDPERESGPLPAATAKKARSGWHPKHSPGTLSTALDGPRGAPPTPVGEILPEPIWVAPAALPAPLARRSRPGRKRLVPADPPRWATAAAPGRKPPVPADPSRWGPRPRASLRNGGAPLRIAHAIPVWNGAGENHANIAIHQAVYPFHLRHAGPDPPRWAPTKSQFAKRGRPAPHRAGGTSSPRPA